MNVGGDERFAVSKEILLQAEDSLLFRKFSNGSPQKIGERVFIDRDPEAFRLMLHFLRSKRQKKPYIRDLFLKELFELEIAFWAVDHKTQKQAEITDIFQT